MNKFTKREESEYHLIRDLLVIVKLVKQTLFQNLDQLNSLQRKMLYCRRIHKTRLKFFNLTFVQIHKHKKLEDYSHFLPKIEVSHLYVLINAHEFSLIHTQAPEGKRNYTWKILYLLIYLSC